MTVEASRFPDKVGRAVGKSLEVRVLHCDGCALGGPHKKGIGVVVFKVVFLQVSIGFHVEVA